MASFDLSSSGDDLDITGLSIDDLSDDYISDDDFSDDELLEEQDWYYGTMQSSQIKKRLREDGDFLVYSFKDSMAKATKFMLSVFWGEKMEFPISHDRTGWSIEGNQYPTLPVLINHLSRKPVSDKSRIILKRPVIREGLKLKDKDIVLDKKIGSGYFGDVYLALYKPLNKDVAVKICSKEMTEREKNNFLREGAILGKFTHPNIVHLIGIATDSIPKIVMEYVAGGDLQKYLKDNRTSIMTASQIRMCKHAAKGMAYLEKKKCIHRDLAARNCLVGDKSKIKITDFGMSREEDVYVMYGSTNLPIRWSAPESLKEKKYTTKSDVWSFGILMWEIFSKGEVPYPNIPFHDQVAFEVKKGYTMDAPIGTPKDCAKLMKICWNYDPNDRYSFKKIKRELTQIHWNY